MKLMWLYSTYKYVFGLFCHIDVNKSWNICDRNFKFYTHVHLSTINMDIIILDNIFSVY